MVLPHSPPQTHTHTPAGRHGAGCVWASTGDAPRRLLSVRVNHKSPFTSSLASIRPSVDAPPPHPQPSHTPPRRLSQAQVTPGGVASLPRIHQTATSSGRRLNLGSYYSDGADGSEQKPESWEKLSCDFVRRSVFFFCFPLKRRLFSPVNINFAAGLAADARKWADLPPVTPPLWHRKLLTSSTSLLFPSRPCSPVWCPLTQKLALVRAHAHTDIENTEFLAIRLIWCELTASHGSNQWGHLVDGENKYFHCWNLPVLFIIYLFLFFLQYSDVFCCKRISSSPPCARSLLS